MTDDAVKVVPVAQMVALLKDNALVGVEVMWDKDFNSVSDACSMLNITRAAMGDSAWIVRQVERVSTHKQQDDAGSEATVQ